MEIPIQAIKNLVGTDYGYTFDQVNFDTLVFHDGIKRLDESDYDAEVIRLQAEYDAQEYARNRKEEYDALNQLEMQFDDKEDGTTTWEDAIKAIKTKYPKG